ncbi:MAG: biopolymer transporter ExbD [Alistipes sp.]|nr:biopolymer transporter ExbD [Rikenellaceae bacterium]MBQ2959383.1 biopolymer transporter ExbD [Alistipes sp.]MBQ5828621.1 biopolymer transporter ExbD [Alistipes sp.]MBR2110135.1 biopolymer transporter ExbD [Alistipes sp.]MBR3589944.1 biopolymer transporter ExbD [Alistipes sp.]
MAVMAKKGKREVPAMSTSSLPDIVFMLLFFFMAATTMREVDPLVTVQMPEAHEITELDKKNLVNIWMGKPLNAAAGEDALKIQLNDQTRDVEDIREFISATTVTKGVGPRDIVVNLRVDQGATVGKLTAVKQELRKADAISIAYAAKATSH